MTPFMDGKFEISTVFYMLCLLLNASEQMANPLIQEQFFFNELDRRAADYFF